MRVVGVNHILVREVEIEGIHRFGPDSGGVCIVAADRTLGCAGVAGTCPIGAWAGADGKVVVRIGGCAVVVHNHHIAQGCLSVVGEAISKGHIGRPGERKRAAIWRVACGLDQIDAGSGKTKIEIRAVLDACRLNHQRRVGIDNTLAGEYIASQRLAWIEHRAGNLYPIDRSIEGDLYIIEARCTR